ncbi:hypothetical protein DPEC_G00171250 [Dallia pectoralis]|uniref:Uncharacterized protein n=1 Tax=Dallia pectoralis TaxID=75939 RepID=A0ACC2GDD2_DALPE|nr:hypothetical protein DPEC_G00171250 [Dallia pectoralis]
MPCDAGAQNTHLAGNARARSQTLTGTPAEREKMAARTEHQPPGLGWNPAHRVTSHFADKRGDFLPVMRKTRSQLPGDKEAGMPHTQLKITCAVRPRYPSRCLTGWRCLRSIFRLIAQRAQLKGARSSQKVPVSPKATRQPQRRTAANCCERASHLTSQPLCTKLREDCPYPGTR